VDPVRVEEGEVEVPEEARPGFQWPAVVEGEVKVCRLLVRPEDVPPETQVIELR
jgi:archaeosine synthase